MTECKKGVSVPMSPKLKAFLGFNWMALAIMVAAAIMLGILTNLRVDDEKRVEWFGGSVAADDDDGEVE